MLAIEYTSSAQRRLRKIRDRDGYNDGTGPGAETVRDIVAHGERLREHPRLGAVEEQLADLRKGHRSLLVGRRHRIVYRIEGERIYVTDVFDVRRDPIEMKG